MSNLKLSFILEAIDKATAPMRKTAKAIDQLGEPAKRVSRYLDQVYLRFGRLMGHRLGRQWGEISDRGKALSQSAQGIAQTFGAVTIAAGGAFYAIKRTIDETDRAVDVSKKLGIGVEKFQELGFAAKMSGSNQEQMGQSLQYLSRNMIAATTGSEEMATWFKRAGIPLEKLKKMNAAEVFAAIADKFQAVGDAGQNAEKKTALMMALMGRSGADMRELLDGGSEGLKEFAKRARELGVVVDSKTAKAMADFNDNFDELGGSIFGVMSEIAKSALPALDGLVKKFTELNVASRAEWGKNIGLTINNIVAALPGFLKTLGKIAGALVVIAGAADFVAQAMGGWLVVIYAVAAVVGLKLVIGLYALGAALAAIVPTIWTLGAALMATPLGWFMAAIALIAGAIYLIYRNWEPIKAFFVGLWEGVKSAFLSVYNFIAGKLGAILAFAGKVIETVNRALPSGGQLDTGGYDSMGNATGYGAPPESQERPTGYGATPGVQERPTGYGATPGVQEQPRGRSSFNVSSALPTGSAAKADVGVTLNIKIDQEGRARVAEVKSNNPSVDYSVYTGMTMAGA